MNDCAELDEFAQRYAKAWCSQNPESVAAFFAENGSIGSEQRTAGLARRLLESRADSCAFSGHDRDLRQTRAARRSDGISLDVDRHVILDRAAREIVFASAGTNFGRLTMTD